MGGNHNINTLTTYPLKNYILGKPHNDSFSKGEINIGNGVWIGFGATILSGVTIGKGAIIGSHAVVVKDIPPYGIAVGNPAKVVKFRFSEEIINEFDNFELSHFTDQFIKDNIEQFYTEIKNSMDVSKMKAKYN